MARPNRVHNAWGMILQLEHQYTYYGVRENSQHIFNVSCFEMLNVERPGYTCTCMYKVVREIQTAHRNHLRTNPYNTYNNPHVQVLYHPNYYTPSKSTIV